MIPIAQAIRNAYDARDRDALEWALKRMEAMYDELVAKHLTPAPGALMSSEPNKGNDDETRR